jgi:hypothetical protein
MQPEPNNYLPEPFRGLSDVALLERWPLEFRFRDEAFVKIWTRWERARTAWRAAWWGCPMNTPPFFTDEECPDHPAAREFVEARRAYHEDLASRRLAEEN